MAWIFFGGKATPGDLPAFETQDLYSRPAQIGLEHQTVVTRSKDDAVVGHSRSRSHWTQAGASVCSEVTLMRFSLAPAMRTPLIATLCALRPAGLKNLIPSS